MRETRVLRFQLLVAIAVAAAPAAFAACGAAGSPASERAARAEAASGEIVIGAAWPWDRRQNMLYAQGLDMAVAEINAAGGVQGRVIRVVREDDHESIDEGRRVAQRFAANLEVVAVIGHLQSYVSSAAAPIYDTAGIVMIVPTSTDPALTSQGHQRVFRTIFTDRDVGRQIASTAAARGYKRAAIYYIRNEYGRGLANAFEERALETGLEIADRQSYDPNGAASGRTIGSVVDTWKLRSVDVVFLATEPSQASLFITEARARALRAAIFGGDALGTPDLFAEDAAAVDGTVVASPFHPDETRPEVERFVTAFNGRYQRRPDAAAALAYDAVQVLVHAMREARSTVPDRVAASLRTLQGHAGVTTRFTFDRNGDLVSPPIVRMVARNGQFTFLKTDAR